MLRACAVAGQHEAAAELLAAMAERRVGAVTRSFATALSACEPQGAARQAVALLAPLVEAVEAEAEAAGEAAAEDIGGSTAFLSLAAPLPGPLPELQAASRADKGVLIACTSAINACQKGGEWCAPRRRPRPNTRCLRARAAVRSHPQRARTRTALASRAAAAPHARPPAPHLPLPPVAAGGRRCRSSTGRARAG